MACQAAGGGLISPAESVLQDETGEQALGVRGESAISVVTSCSHHALRLPASPSPAGTRSRGEGHRAAMP